MKRTHTEQSVGSVKKMDTVQTSSGENNLKQVLKLNDCEPTNFRNDSHSVRILEYLQSQRKEEVLCDIRLEAKDGKIVFGHKIILIAASQYFRGMFSNFKESNKDTVNIRDFDSNILLLLVDYIYTGEIMVTKENVQELLPAANYFQLDYVISKCAEFLQKQLNPSNWLGIRAFAALHHCTDLLSISEAYTKQNFLEVAKGKDFLSLSSDDLVKLISSNDLAVPFEEKVFECVIKWVKHDSDHRIDFLPKLMEHVRLPLLKPDILFNISEEPLLKNSHKICKDYIIIEAFHFNHQKSVQHFTIPKTIRFKPREFDGFQKGLLTFSRSKTSSKCYTEWYDPATKLRENAPGINECRKVAGFGVINDQFVFAVGGVHGWSSKSVTMLDVSSQSPSWVRMADMLVSRMSLGVGVLDDCIYAVGGCDSASNSVELFDVSTQKWRMVSSMTIERRYLGVGVLNNCLYAVGGSGNRVSYKSVEYYDPTLDIWTQVAEMSECREGVGVGVLDGLMYAIGGHNGNCFLKSVEVYRPSDGVWSSIADMNLGRFCPGVAVLNGLLYVFGGEFIDESIVDTFEIYNPNTNSWTLERLSRSVIGGQIYGGVVVDRPHHYH